jgi:hypothetical protein
MNYLGDTKLNRVVSTKITEEEHKRLEVIAKYLQLLGYIAKANPSEAIRFLLRASMEWTSSHMNYRKARFVGKTQSSTSISRNPTTTSVGSASRIDKMGDTGQPLSHGNIPRGNISSIGIAHESSEVLGNKNNNHTNDTTIRNYNKSLAQKVSVGSNNTRNQTENFSGNTNNIIQHSDSTVSQVDKSLTDVSGPSLETIGEYWRLLKQLPRPTRDPLF